MTLMRWFSLALLAAPGLAWGQDAKPDDDGKKPAEAATRGDAEATRRRLDAVQRDADAAKRRVEQQAATLKRQIEQQVAAARRQAEVAKRVEGLVRQQPAHPTVGVPAVCRHLARWPLQAWLHAAWQQRPQSVIQSRIERIPTLVKKIAE